MMAYEMTPLCGLALKYGTDKGGNHLLAGETCHQYTPTYYKLLEPYRYNIKSVLEIGVNYGPSLRMWRDFFPNAHIIGLDSNAECLFNEERIECFAEAIGILGLHCFFQLFDGRLHNLIDQLRDR